MFFKNKQFFVSIIFIGVAIIVAILFFYFQKMKKDLAGTSQITSDGHTQEFVIEKDVLDKIDETSKKINKIKEDGKSEFEKQLNVNQENLRKTSENEVYPAKSAQEYQAMQSNVPSGGFIEPPAIKPY